MENLFLLITYIFAGCIVVIMLYTFLNTIDTLINAEKYEDIESVSKKGDEKKDVNTIL